MKFIKIGLGFLSFSLFSFAQQPTAKDIIKKASDLMQGETNENTMTMTIVRPTWQRSVSWCGSSLVTPGLRWRGMTTTLSGI